jgi:hypothetical protein
MTQWKIQIAKELLVRLSEVKVKDRLLTLNVIPDLAEVQSVGQALPTQMHGSKRIDDKAFFDVSTFI